MDTAACSAARSIERLRGPRNRGAKAPTRHPSATKPPPDDGVGRPTLLGGRQPTVSDRPEPFRYVIRVRDQKFTDTFDEVFRSAGCEIIRTPFRAPQANGVAERFVRTVRSECLDWLLILNEQHLKHVLADFVARYDGHRPHRALGLKPPHPTRSSVAPAGKQREIRVERRDRLGGLIHEYVLAA